MVKIRSSAYGYRAIRKTSFFLSRRFLLLMFVLCALVLWLINSLWGLDLRILKDYLQVLLALLLLLILIAVVVALFIFLYRLYKRRAHRATKTQSFAEERSPSKR